MGNNLSFQAFYTAHRELTNLIGNPGEDNLATMYGVLKNSDARMKAALQDGERGGWAASKIDAWNQAYASVMPKLDRLVALMTAAGAGNANYQQWVAQQNQTSYY